MNSGQYQRQPQLHHGLPISFQYSDNSDVSLEQSTSSQRMLNCDGLPRSQVADHQFTNTSPSSLQYDSVNSMPLSMSHPTQLWTNPNHHTSSFIDDPNNSAYYDYASGLTNGNNHGAWMRNIEDPGVPRWLPEEDIRSYNNNNNNNNQNMPTNSYEPAMYMIDPNTAELPHLNNNSCNPYPSLEGPRDFSRLSISHSPGPRLKSEDDNLGLTLSYKKDTPFGGSNDSSEDGRAQASRETTAVDMEDPGTEEPYAKLIYRALMSAENYSMVLQEIYQWFRDNTTKGAADGKGWMNSIRHNLSMNAAFKKTERKVPGDDAKKSTEWVLEPFAIKDGVQSTTRYRKGTSTKKIPRHDNYGHLHHSTPHRQSSARKGGLSSASKTKIHRQRGKDERERIGGYDANRGNGNVYGGGGGGGIPSSGNQRSTTHGIDSLRRAQFDRHTKAHISEDRRQRSPLTPPSAGAGDMGPGAGPYFGGVGGGYVSKVEGDGGLDLYSLEDVQGVYFDDTAVFSDDGLGGGGGGSAMVGIGVGAGGAESGLGMGMGMVNQRF